MLPLRATGDTPLSEPPREPLLPTVAETRQATLAAFLAAPRLRDPARIQMGDISILLYLVMDTTGRLVALSCITPPISSTEATGIWGAWSSHLEHE